MNQLSLFQKIIISGTSLGVICALTFIIYNQIQLSNQQLTIDKSIIAQKNLLDGIIRSQSSWANKDDIEKYIKDNNINLSAIKKDLDKMSAELSSINVAISTSQGQVGTDIPTTPGTGYNPNPIDPTNPDQFGYLKNQQQLTLNEQFSTIKVPFGKVGFSAWKQKPWDIDIKSREYKLSTIVGIDEDQRQYFYNKFVIKVDDKEYTVPIQYSTTQQIFPESKFSFFNPRLYIGADVSFGLNSIKGELSPSLSLQFMSFGKFKRQPDFSILQLGVAGGLVSQRPMFTLTPFAYNVGKHLPFMNNTYLGPAVSLDTAATIYVGLGLRVGL